MKKKKTDRLEELKEDLAIFEELLAQQRKRLEEVGADLIELNSEIVRFKWNIKDIKEKINAYNPERASNKVFLIDIV